MTRKSTINRTLKLMLTLCGIWPGISCVIICRVYWIIALTTDEICHYRYLSMHLHTNNLFDLMDCFSSFIAEIKFSTKLIIFWMNEQKFLSMLTMMADDWNDCVDGDFNMRETVHKAKLANRITNAMFTLHMLSIVGYSIGIFMADVDVTDQQSELPLLMKVKLPISISTKRTYKTLLTAQFVYLLISGCGTGLLNALLLTLIFHVGGQINILRNWLKELVLTENEEKHESIDDITNKIIRKHQRIISFSEYIEDLYTYIALVQFTSNTVMMCSLGFLIVTTLGNPNATEQIVKYLLFYAITNLEAFIFCFAGEYIKNKSTAIGAAAYDSAWYDFKPKNSRNLIFVILRSQKQLTLTVGKIMELSLESFTSIMKASGSYLSVLLAMQ